jgi:hypothetical protein
MALAQIRSRAAQGNTLAARLSPMNHRTSRDVGQIVAVGRVFVVHEHAAVTQNRL